jgi:tetratricopeptide (TPR) repeat protein
MMRSLQIVVFLLFIFCAHPGFAQKKAKEDAVNLLKRALILEEQGKINEAISNIEKARKLDPANPEYPYELAFANNLKKDYPKVVFILEKQIAGKDAFSKMYQLLGNAYDILERQYMAVKIYQDGIKRFPEAGELYLELGNIYLKRKDYTNALAQYETGIEMDPMFPSNYYRAARLFLRSPEKVWGMIYGELFLLLEIKSERTTEISKLLYDTYKKEIVFNADTLSSIRLSSDLWGGRVIGKDTSLKLNYGLFVYQPLMIEALNGEKNIDINSLSRIRKRFTEKYFTSDNWQKYPNALFDFHYKVLKAGFMDEYNQWVFADANTEDFSKWQEKNRDRYLKFIKWLLKNTPKFDAKYKFYRSQY